MAHSAEESAVHNGLSVPEPIRASKSSFWPPSAPVSAPTVQNAMTKTHVSGAVRKSRPIGRVIRSTPLASAVAAVVPAAASSSCVLMVLVS